MNGGGCGDDFFMDFMYRGFVVVTLLMTGCCGDRSKGLTLFTSILLVFSRL